MRGRGSRRWRSALALRAAALLLPLCLAAPGCGRATFVVVTLKRMPKLILSEVTLVVRVRQSGADGGAESNFEVPFKKDKVVQTFSLQFGGDYSGKVDIEVARTEFPSRTVTVKRTADVEAGANREVVIDLGDVM